MGKAKTPMLMLNALEVRQGKRRVLQFSVDGKLIHKFAAISRLRREEQGDLFGYQRPEVYSHIEEIKRYVESEGAMIPNAIVLALSSKVKFQTHASEYAPQSHSRFGTLHIPYEEGMAEEDKPAWVVDGQQRLAAVRESNVESFPLLCSAFVTDDRAEQTDQFLLVNSTKPLARGLVYELLPSTQARLPSALLKKRFPAAILAELNGREESPFKGRIQTATNPAGTIKDNSVLRMLEASLTDGALYRIHRERGEDGLPAMVDLVSDFYAAVAKTFPDAWERSPKESRLVHGAGILSTGLLMDTITDRYRPKVPSARQFEKDLEPLKEICRWTDGFWDFGPNKKRKWNELENTSTDIRELSNHLQDAYKALVWSRAGSRTEKHAARGA